ncbi:MAG: polynucleotide adenylyltransferase PcnB [Steroidobacteraceae bacterium]|nr:polynucleotide adenylyltransferase PcnB [Steroidobacteraceae bacterium]
MNSFPASLEAVPQLARVIPRDSHPISRSRISPDALRVLYRLKEAGYQAFLVGGCVRDLTLGLEPKDFDVATNAQPEDVRRLFRNCRLVGRRFRLAHVFFGRETIEVATFRASTAPGPAEDPVVAEADDDESVLADEEGVDDDELLDDEDEADFDDEVDAVEGDAVPRDDVTGASSGEASAGVEDDADIVADAGQRRAEPRRESAAAGRGPAERYEDADSERVVNEHGRILRDNVYGTIDEDVWRRDFTANALYYNIADFSVWDYVGGFEDVLAKRLKLIGDPETRYREDPVRMLRAARFEAKLGFTLDPATAEPIARLRELLAGVPAARLFDETLKLFLTGHGVASLAVLRERGLLEVLLPNVGGFLARHPGSAVEKLLMRGLAGTDERVRADRPVTPTFLFAVLLYGPIGAAIESAPRERWNDTGTILDAVDAAVRAIQPRVALPRRFSLGVRDMFAMQPRLEAPRGRRALRLLENPRFRAAFDLLALRAEAGLASRELVEWWISLQQASPQQRADLADSGEAPGGGRSTGPSGGGSGRSGGRRRRRRGGRGSRGGSPQG